MIDLARHSLLSKAYTLEKSGNSSNFEQDLVAGDAWIAQAYNGSLTSALRDEPRIVDVIPKEGCTISFDSACIPRHAPHKDLAHEFISYFHRPEVVSAFVNDSDFNSPNLFATSGVELWMLAQAAIFPEPSPLTNGEFMRDVGPAIALYDRYWTEIKSR